MKRSKASFRKGFLIYLAVLAVLVAAATLRVRAVLRSYENAQPEHRMEEVVAELRAAAADGTFFQKYRCAVPEPGALETGIDVRRAYLALCADEQVTYTKAPGHLDEETMHYTVENGGFPLARVTLRAAGPLVTRLAIFSSREWAVDSVEPLLEKHDYTLSVPEGFAVRLNGAALDGQGEPTEDGEIRYALAGLYLRPSLEIAAPDGAPVSYTIKNDRILPEIYRYQLTLPDVLELTLDGAPLTGESAGEGIVHYDILRLREPKVVISDHYGNTVDYRGGSALPLTYVSLLAPEGFTVRVDGAPAAPQDVVLTENPEYAQFADFVPELPRLASYRIAVLHNGVPVTVTDSSGAEVPLAPGESSYDLTRFGAAETVPDGVRAAVDALHVVEQWSLFMSNDLAFSRLSPYLLQGSYQYQVAHQYATGIDIRFTSRHTLGNPPFTDESVGNYLTLTERCFCVDVHFVKHMNIANGLKMEDEMNVRCYFVFYDDTDNGVSDPAWKLAAMKEIV